MLMSTNIGTICARQISIAGTLKPLADWLHDRNFSFGMYTSAGYQTCSTGGRQVPGNANARGVSGSYGHYEQDARTYAEWGVDYVKLDKCMTKGPGPKNPPTMEPYTTAFRKALDASGRKIWLNFHCDGAYAPWCAEDGNSWRIGQDHHDIWSNTEGCIEALATVNQNNQTGPFRWADPDFLMTGGAGCDVNETAVRCPGQTELEYRTEMSLWTLAAAQILVATDLRQMTPFMKEVLLHDEMLAIHQDAAAIPGGRIQYINCGGSSSGGGGAGGAGTPASKCQLWARALSGGRVVVGLYNTDETAHAMAVSVSDVWAVVGKGGQTAASVRDVWQRKDLGQITGSLQQAAVGVHETKVFLFTPPA